MQYQTIIGKMSEYLLSSANSLSKWLERHLPMISNDWWMQCVISKLSYNQRNIVESNSITSLRDLDLSALLRIADKNWYAIQQQVFLNHSERTCLKAMFTVRNNWAHCTAATPQINLITSDLETIIDFLGQLDAEKSVLADAEKLFNTIKSEGIPSPISSKTSVEVLQAKYAETTQPASIAINSLVHLKSSPDIKGIVTGISVVGNTQKLEVFIDGRIRTFFIDQLEAEAIDVIPKTTDVDSILRMLTAYQINKPSSESLYSLNSARVDFVPYQFRPALKLIKSDTPRLLIADSVGVGKTIEAGFILKEMQARTPLDSILVICPKPLVAERKWETEMKRFDEDFVSVNGNELRNILLDADRDGVWPERYKRLIIPYSLLTEDLLEGQNKKHRRVVGLKKLDPAPLFDMVIVDEAHHIRNSNTQAYKAVKFFCEHANSAVFLTATPLQLGNEDLFTLLNLLFPDIVIDKTTFAAMSEPNPHINEVLHNLRLSKHESEALDALRQAASTEWGRTVIASNPVYSQAVEILSSDEVSREQRVKLINDVESLHSFSHMINRTRRQDIDDFCVRRATTLESNFTAHQAQLHDSLLEFEASVLRVLHGNISGKFLMSMISRQAASCIFGLAPTLRSLAEKRLSELADEYDFDVDLDEINFGSFKSLAEEVVALAENLPQEDPKFDSLVGILQEKHKLENNKVIIFSTFRHTLTYLKKRIAAIGGMRVEQVNGSVKDDERYTLRERFALPKSNPQALDILLFTEVGSEGLDYQFCDTIINYDLPWNPMRIEQRIGRIDRRGQQSEIAHIYNCITDGTIDAEIFNRCLSRIGVFEQSIGECSEILGDIADSIQIIVFDSTLTEFERSNKLEQLADNEVRRMQEMHRLEDEEKQMFGLDLSSFTDDIEKAENPWISPDALKRLLLGYLRSRLNSEKKYINDNRLSLTMAEKEELLKDYKALGGNPDNSWARFLRGSATSCRIVFEQDEAKDQKIVFITPQHPLVRQAAATLANYEEMRTAIKVVSTDIAPGEYPFLLFAWEYTGNRPRVNLVAVCANDDVQAELPVIIQSAVTIEVQLERYVPDWERLEESHYLLWQNERNSFREEARSLCRFKLESLTKSVSARKSMVEKQLSEVIDQKIITMRTSELERLNADYNAKKDRLEGNTELTDIHATKLVSGVLIVEGGIC